MHTQDNGDARLADVENYLELGWALCAIAPGDKRPVGDNWTLRPRSSEWFRRNPEHGIGLIHGPSGTCSLDIDDYPEAERALAKEGIDLSALLAAGVLIDSGRKGRAKALYQLPPGADFRRHAVMVDRTCAYELRAGMVQDVLPPSIHPVTGKPYRWVGDYMDLPELPEELAALWRRMEEGERPGDKAEGAKVREHEGIDLGVIGRFNAAASLDAILADAGYLKVGSRWIAPSSTSGQPGVVLLRPREEGEPPRVYSHHGSDRLADGFAHDAFSVWCVLFHEGNAKEAVRSAAESMEDDEEVELYAAQLMKATGTDARPSQPSNLVAFPQRESAEDDEPDTLTMLDLPHPGMVPVAELQAAAEWFAAGTHAPKTDAILQATIALACAIAGRRYCCPDGRPVSAHLCITDTSTAGIRSLRLDLLEIIAEMGERQIIRGTGFTSGSAVHRTLMRCPRAVWATDELGHMLAMARRQQSGAIESALAVVAEAYEGRTLYVDPDTGGWGRKERPIEECDIFHPALTVLSLIPHDQVGALAQRGEYGRGTLQQLLVVEAGDCTTSDHRPSFDRVVPESCISIARKMRTRAAGPPGALASPDDEANLRPNLSPVRVTREAWAVLREGRQLMVDALGVEQYRHWRGMAHGYHAASLRISCALAAWKRPDNPVVCEEIASWASQWAIRCLRHVVPRLSVALQGSEAPGVDELVEQVVLRAGPAGITMRNAARACRAFRRLDNSERHKLFGKLVDDGIFFELASGRRTVYVHRHARKGAK